MTQIHIVISKPYKLDINDCEELSVNDI